MHNKKVTVQKTATPANRKMNKTVYCQKTATPANKKMNAPAKVSPSK